MLEPFVVTAWHGGTESVMPDDVKTILQNSEVGKDPKRLNVFMFVLDPGGRLVHGFHGLPASRGSNDGRSDYRKEIPIAIARLKLPAEKLNRKEDLPVVLPDLKAADGAAPAGVRLFLKSPSKTPVVEVVAIPAEEWKALALPEKTKAIDAAALKNWLIQVYPPAIRAADEKKPFTRFTGSLKLEPAGADKQARYALLRGEIKLAKADENGSAFEGTLQAVLTYGLESPDVKSVRAVVEGDYLYKTRGTQRIPVVAAVESRPE
jgi:hypothetical protein